MPLGLSDGIDEGLPLNDGLLLGCELGSVETLGFVEGEDDGEPEGLIEGKLLGSVEVDGLSLG